MRGGLILIMVGLLACDFQPPKPPPQPAQYRNPRSVFAQTPKPTASPTPDEAKPIGVYRNGARVPARALQNPEENNESNRPSSSIPKVGEQAYLQSPSGRLVPVARTNEDLDQLVKADMANDSIGKGQMVLEGRAWGVQSGTKCLILDFRVWSGHRNVRLLDGDYAGRSCWTQREFIQP